LARYQGHTHSIGLIAQEVMPVLPEALSLETVGDSEVQYYQLDYTKFIPHLIGAIKELAAKVAGLAERVISKEVVAINGRFDTLRTCQLCVDDICITRDQFLSVFGASALSQPAAASASGAGTETPGGAPAPEASEDADAATSTTPSDNAPPAEVEAAAADAGSEGGAAGAADTHTSAATGSATGSADQAESARPTVTPQDDSTATAPGAEFERADEPAVPEPANDNSGRFVPQETAH
jgi:hypothetical protein